MNDLRIKQIFTLSLIDFKKKWKISILLVVPFFVLEIINYCFGITSSIEQNPASMKLISEATISQILISVIILLLQIFLTIGLIRTFLNIVDKKKVTLKQLLTTIESPKHYFNFILTHIYVILSVIIPSVILAISIKIGWSFINPSVLWIDDMFFILSIIYILTVTQFAFYFSAENKCSPTTAIKKSFIITNCNIFELLSLTIIMIVFNILGYFALIIGLLITLPITALIFSHTYRFLEHKKTCF